MNAAIFSQNHLELFLEGLIKKKKKLEVAKNYYQNNDISSFVKLVANLILAAFKSNFIS
jgi:hypothetical protein